MVVLADTFFSADTFWKITLNSLWFSLTLFFMWWWFKFKYFRKRDKATEGLSNKCRLLIRWLHENEVDIIVEDGQLKFDPPKTKVPKKIKQLVIENRTELAQFAEKFGSIRDI